MYPRKKIFKNITWVLGLAWLGVLIFLANPVLAAGVDYPNRVINIIVPFPPGGAAWNSSQIFADGGKKYFSNPQPIILNAKPGAAGAVAADYVLKQPADGYTLFCFPNDFAHKLAKDGSQLAFKMEDFIFIGNHLFTPQLLVVSKEKSPFKTLEEFIDYAKKHPGKLSYGSVGIGSSTHLAIENIMSQTGIKLNQIPFAGTPMTMTALLGGHVDCIIVSPPNAMDQIRPGGGMRVLAILGPQRLPDLPDVPTCIEKGYNINRGFWCGLAVAKGTPQPVLDILWKVFKNTANDPQVKENITKFRFLPMNWDSEEMRKKAQEEFRFAQETFKKAGL